ncbi:MAG: hypothetical protein KGR26_00080 [Cyanobacteria bacterium REEB65]|nr:hypothetical protein [Cyanobacteria bacterium REEB65]
MAEEDEVPPVGEREELLERRARSLERSAQNVEEFRRRSQAPSSANEHDHDTPPTPTPQEEEQRVRARDLHQARLDLENGETDAAIEGILGSPFPDAEKEEMFDRLVREAPDEEIRAAILARIERVWVRRGNKFGNTKLYDIVWDSIFGPRTESRKRQENRWRQAELSARGQALLERLKEIESGLATAPELRRKLVADALREAVEPFYGPNSLPLSKKNKKAVDEMLASALIGSLSGLKLGLGALGAPSFTKGDVEEILGGGNELSFAPAHGEHFGQRRWQPEPGSSSWWHNFLGSGRSLYQLLDQAGIGNSAALGAERLNNWLIGRRVNHLLEEPPPPPGHPGFGRRSPPPGPPDDDGGGGGGGGGPPPAPPGRPIWPHPEENASEQMLRLLAEHRKKQGQPRATETAPKEKKKRGRPLGSKDTVKRKTPVRKKKRRRQEEEEEEKGKRRRGGLPSEFLKSLEGLEGKRRRK